MRKNGLMGNALSLCCQNHPNDEGIKAANSTDFQAAPEGGCGKMCDIRLECGHVCDKFCHVKNRDHTNIICKKPCAKRCENGHQCRKLCWEKCYCEEEIIQTLPQCGHIVYCKCSAVVDKVNCNETCRRKLDCGHECRKKCSQRCICMEQVTVTLPKCGHRATIPCSVNPNRHKCSEYIEILRTDCGHLERVLCCNATTDTYCQMTCDLLSDCSHVCKAKCGQQSSQELMNDNDLSRCPAGHSTTCVDVCKVKLQCGHVCSGKCESCFKGRWHRHCKEECNCDLICGHKCKGKCGFCRPCTERCTRRCSHSVCKEPCIEICKPCKKPCKWNCKHFRCNKLCGEICDRPRCDKPCLKSLPCKHKCIGMCGDPCPSLCRICNKKEVCVIRFGNENLPDARFVQLQDCNHIIKYEYMDKYMDCDEGLSVKRCPICKKRIIATFGNRYESTVNKINKKINEVKTSILQDSELFITLDAIANKCDPVSFSSKYSSSESFIFLDPRGALSLLNIKAVENFIEFVSTENSYPLNNEGFICPHENMHMSSQKLIEIRRELTRYFDKCHVEKINKIFEAEHGFDLKIKTVFEKANKCLDKVLYREDDREKVQQLINGLPEIPNISKKLLRLSLSLTEIDRDTTVKSKDIKPSFYKLNVEQSHSMVETANMNKKQDSTYSHDNVLTNEQEKTSMNKQNVLTDQTCQQHTSLVECCTEGKSGNSSFDIKTEEKNNNTQICKVNRDDGTNDNYRHAHINEIKNHDASVVDGNIDADERNDFSFCEDNKDEQNRGKIASEINRNRKKNDGNKSCLSKSETDKGKHGMARECSKEGTKHKRCERKSVVEEKCASVFFEMKNNNNKTSNEAYRDEQKDKRNETCIENNEEEDGNEDITSIIKGGAKYETDHTCLEMKTDASKAIGNENTESGSNTGKGNDNKMIEMDSGAGEGYDNAEEDGQMADTANKDKDPIYCLNFLTWSGYPYFFYSSEAGSKRKLLNTAKEQSAQKKSKTENREHNSEKTKRLHSFKDSIGPPRKRPKEMEMNTGLQVCQQTSSGSSYKIPTQEQNKETNHVLLETDTRIVRIRNIQSGNRLNMNISETVNTDLGTSIKKSMPSESEQL